MERRKNILVSPLEWGLGHAARMIPLARLLTDMGHNVIFAAGESLRPFIEQELPGTRFLLFPGFSPVYSSRFPQYLVLLFQVPRLILHSVREHRALEKIISDNDIDIVISDNRFGLWHKGIVSVYVTHMPRIPFPPPFRFLEFTGILLHRMIMNKYSFCLIPDLPGSCNLSGKLSHNLRLPPNTRYAGILSRFGHSHRELLKTTGRKRQVALILSGPEPQRSILGRRLSEKLAGEDIPVIIAGGNPSDRHGKNGGKIISAGHLPLEGLAELLGTSRYIICRPGYTTLMELASLGRSALLVPTPGQTEQEYLASALSAKGWFGMILQKDLQHLKLTGMTDPGIAPDMTGESEALLLAALEEILKQ